MRSRPDSFDSRPESRRPTLDPTSRPNEGPEVGTLFSLSTKDLRHIIKKCLSIFISSGPLLPPTCLFGWPPPGLYSRRDLERTTNLGTGWPDVFRV